MGHSILQQDMPDDEDYDPTITASQTTGGNFDTHLLRGSRASTYIRSLHAKLTCVKSHVNMS